MQILLPTICFHLILRNPGFFNPKTSLCYQAPLVYFLQGIFLIPFRHKCNLVATFKTYLDGKLYKIDYALRLRDAPGTVEVCRTVCPFTKWSQMTIVFQFLCLLSIIFCLLSAANLLCLLHFPQILTHKMSLLKIHFCFWKSEIARLVTITIHFLIQEFKVHTQ